MNKLSAAPCAPHFANHLDDLAHPGIWTRPDVHPQMLCCKIRLHTDVGPVHVVPTPTRERLVTLKANLSDLA